MATTDSPTKTHRSRAAVRQAYGHPWPWHSKTILEREYVDHDRTITDLAEDFGCSDSTVWAAVVNFGLEKGAAESEGVETR